MVLSQFDKRNLFGEAMRKVAPSITLIADGNTPRMSDTLTDNHWAIGGELRRISFRGTRPSARVFHEDGSVAELQHSGDSQRDLKSDSRPDADC